MLNKMRLNTLEVDPSLQSLTTFNDRPVFWSTFISKHHAKHKMLNAKSCTKHITSCKTYNTCAICDTGERRTNTNHMAVSCEKPVPTFIFKFKSVANNSKSCSDAPGACTPRA